LKPRKDVEMEEHVCPVWVGHLLASPLRKLFQNPEKILGPHVREGMTVADLGCAMGFFSLPLARMVGPSGRVVCVDMQDKMLSTLEKRAQKAGVRDVIETRLCKKKGLGLEDLGEGINFVLACYMVHEVPDIPGLFAEVGAALKTGGRMLVLEPKGHVSAEEFRQTVATAREKGFRVVDEPGVRRSRSALLEKTGA